MGFPKKHHGSTMEIASFLGHFSSRHLRTPPRCDRQAWRAGPLQRHGAGHGDHVRRAGALSWGPMSATGGNLGEMTGESRGNWENISVHHYFPILCMLKNGKVMMNTDRTCLTLGFPHQKVSMCKIKKETCLELGELPWKSENYEKPQKLRVGLFWDWPK